MTHARRAPPSFWRDRRVFVTGATGLLGSWLTLRLVGAGAHVVALVRDWVPRSRTLREDAFADVTIVRGELEDFDLLLRALNEYEVETCFHLAAQTIVSIANRAPRGTFETNVRGTWNLLEAARQTPTLGRLVVASSDKAYGDQPELPYREDAPLRGLHPYDVSKSCADLIAQAYARTYRLPLCVSRCGNLYGGGDLNFNRLVPGTMRSVYRGERPVIRSDGSPLRDYLYVDDAAAAYLALAEAMDREEVRGEAFNFGPQRPVTVREAVDAILRVAGREDLEPRVLGRGRLPGEIQDQYLDGSKAQRLLGWTPARTLEDGLRPTWAWYREHLEGPA